jgi:predicted transcriptional regulator
MNRIKHFFTYLFRQPGPTRPVVRAETPPLACKVIGMISHTTEVELTCDEVFELLDQFTEMAQRGENVAALMPLVHQHLEMCPECLEEYEALKRVLEHG